MLARPLSSKGIAVQSSERIHYMDNLRALAMVGGVVFHAALAYSPLVHPIWPTADAGQSVLVDAVAWFLHMFRMPLFFAVAGFFAALLVAHRGLMGLFRNRCARVLLPLVLFLPLVHVSMSWLTEQAVATTGRPSPLLMWLRGYMAHHGAMPSAPGWAHLWFLFYLMLFTVFVWVAATFEVGRIGHWIAALPSGVLILIVPLFLAAALVGSGVPWPAPEYFIPSLWALLFFGGYFALGYQLFHHGDHLDRLRPVSLILLVGAVAAWAGLFWVTDGLTITSQGFAQHYLHTLLEACAGFWMTLWCLLAAKQWLAGRNAAMRWIADASYWVYLVHLPVLFLIQYRLLDVQMHWAAKFAISTVSVLVLSFASYQGLVRYTVIGRLLNGKIPNLRQKEEVAPPA